MLDWQKSLTLNGEIQNDSGLSSRFLYDSAYSYFLIEQILCEKMMLYLKNHLFSESVLKGEKLPKFPKKGACFAI